MVPGGFQNYHGNKSESRIYQCFFLDPGGFSFDG